MLKKIAPHPREQLAAAPMDVLRCVPAIGRLMITANHLNVTHERIGAVDAVAFADGWAVLGGDAHNSRIELNAVATIVVDRTSVMKDKAYPRIELNRADGTTIASIVGFEGLEPFEAAVLPLGSGTPVEAKAEKGPMEKSEVAGDDPAHLAFARAIATGAPCEIAFRQPGFTQSWHGVLEETRDAMGFVNVIRGDFHLHIKAGAIAEWREEQPGQFAAVSPGGETIGLTVRLS